MPKTKEQYEQIKAERKKQIIEVALYLFSIKGYRGVHSDEISKEVGCSHGLVYHYFPTKESLWIEMFEEVVKPINRQIIDNVDFNKSPKEVLTQLLDGYLNAIANKDDKYACVINLLLNLHWQKQDLPKIKSSDPKYRLGDILKTLFEKGQKECVFYESDAKEMLVTLLSCLKGISFSRIHVGTKKFIRPNTEIITRMIVKGGK